MSKPEAAASRHESVISAWDAVRYVLAAVVLGFGMWYYLFYTPGSTVSREVTGKTMGTNYTVKVADCPEKSDWGKTTAEIQTLLDSIDGKMSTYRSDSDVCRFSVSTDADAWFSVSLETAAVVQTSLEMAALTGGAFDITAAPVVQLWGFGAGKAQAEREPKTLEELKRLSQEWEAKTGYRHLSVRLDPPALKKAIPELSIDLSAVAKGYAVDAVAEYLDRRHFAHYIIEIGGEVRCKGKKAKNKDWFVGIEKPIADTEELLQQRFALGDRALATSGNYRQTRTIEGEAVSHIIDPRTCQPVGMNEAGSSVSEALVSVAVIMPDCMRADAWATAMFVLGEKDGLTLADKEGVPVLFLLRKGDTIREAPSKHWHP